MRLPSYTECRGGWNNCDYPSDYHSMDWMKLVYYVNASYT